MIVLVPGKLSNTQEFAEMWRGLVGESLSDEKKGDEGVCNSED